MHHRCASLQPNEKDTHKGVFRLLAEKGSPPHGLATARSPRGSDSPPDCHSLPLSRSQNAWRSALHLRVIASRPSVRVSHTCTSKCIKFQFSKSVCAVRKILKWAEGLEPIIFSRKSRDFRGRDIFLTSKGCQNKGLRGVFNP